MTLNNEEINRYSRHLTLPEVGMEGQLKLKEAKVLMIGAGGLGSPLGMYLGAVGVGKLGLVDFDVVDHTNLHRQIAHNIAFYECYFRKHYKSFYCFCLKSLKGNKH